MMEMLRREKIRDAWVPYKYWAINWMNINQFFLSMPVTVLKGMFRYPWMYDLLKTNALALRHAEGRTGRHKEAILLYYAMAVKDVNDMLTDTLVSTDRLVLSEDMLPPEIICSMGLRPFTMEVPGILMCMMDQHSAHRYMDRAQNEGLPGDTCSLPRVTMGTILEGHIPKAVAILTTNLPCDGGMASYAKLQEITGLPTYRLDVPYNFKDADAIDLFTEDLKNMISFLEKNTPGRMDWEKLRQNCENYNRLNDIEMERFDMLTSDPPPLVGDSVTLPHFYCFNNRPVTKDFIETYHRIYKLMKANYDEGKPAIPNQRYRALLWNPMPTVYSHVENWMERTWGIGIVMDMLSYGYTEPLDTSSNDAMLRSLAKRYMWGTMARHTRGPVSNFFEDIWQAYAKFKCDMVIMAAHVGCKSTMGMLGVLRENCRKRKIPLLVFEYELMDTRVCSRQGIRDQINNFMKNIMKAEPSDPNLLVIDDTMVW